MNKNEKIAIFDANAKAQTAGKRPGHYYHKELSRKIQHIIPRGHSVAHIGCGDGDMLASLGASRALGVDISRAMVDWASKRHPELEFRQCDMEYLDISEKFDYVLITNAIGYVDDVQNALCLLKKLCSPRTRIVIVYFNYTWEIILKIAERLGLRMERPLQHWLPDDVIESFLQLNDLGMVKKTYEIIFPVYIPILSLLLNRILCKMPWINNLCLNRIIVARQPSAERAREMETTVSVVVPCRNEKGNIEAAVERIPDMGKNVEIIFIEGHSTDGTFEECERVKKQRPDKNVKIIKQPGIGKGDAVRAGVAAASGDVAVIFDADLTSPPEDIPKFFQALIADKGELIMGNRMVYQMEEQAMRMLNIFGNKFFSTTFSFLLSHKIRDTLCGTKVFWRNDYERILSCREYFGDFDPFGDFELIFGAAKLNMQILEIPTRYRARVYGETQIDRFRHGWLLLKMAVVAAKKLRFM